MNTQPPNNHTHTHTDFKIGIRLIYSRHINISRHLFTSRITDIHHVQHHWLPKPAAAATVFWVNGCHMSFQTFNIYDYDTSCNEALWKAEMTFGKERERGKKMFREHPREQSALQRLPVSPYTDPSHPSHWPVACHPVGKDENRKLTVGHAIS